MSRRLEREGAVVDFARRLAPMSFEDADQLVCGRLRCKTESAAELDFRARLVTALRDLRIWPRQYRPEERAKRR